MTGRARRLALALALAATPGCTLSGEALQYVVLPEQRALDVHDPAPRPAVRIPPLPPPRTVTDPKAPASPWPMSLDDAIKIALENAKVVRVLAGIAATSSGGTIYDTAITNTAIDQAQARFDPAVTQSDTWNHTDTPAAALNPLDPTRAIFAGVSADDFRSTLGLTKTNVLGGQWGLNWSDDHIRTRATGLPLNPQDRSATELSYTQPFLQGGGFQVNFAPVVLARLDTERSYYVFKDRVQELVRGTVEAYWNLVLARVVVWARQIQVQQSEEAYRREQARMATGFADLRNVAQARVTFQQFRAALIVAEADVLDREGALRNLLGLPPEDGRQIVPTSIPTDRRLSRDWDAVMRLAEQRRPDVVEQKLALEQDQVRLTQAQNQALPRLDGTALYRWNGLSGRQPNGEILTSGPGQFTDWTLGLNLSVPLGRRQGRALVRQQDLTIARDRANLEQTLHAALHQLAITVRDQDSSYDQYLAYRETRAAALDNLRVQMAEFRAGRSIYLNVLQALNDWGSAVTSEAQTLIRYNIDLATLERQTGTILETHGLQLFEDRFRAAGPLICCEPERCYPAAVRPTGSPQRYSPTDAPSENSFDLRNPALPADRPEAAPAPRPVPKP